VLGRFNLKPSIGVKLCQAVEKGSPASLPLDRPLSNVSINTPALIDFSRALHLRPF
jgi:hypothetical protein